MQVQIAIYIQASQVHKYTRFFSLESDTQGAPGYYGVQPCQLADLCEFTNHVGACKCWEDLG